jgi:cytochrome c
MRTHHSTLVTAAMMLCALAAVSLVQAQSEAPRRAPGGMMPRGKGGMMGGMMGEREIANLKQLSSERSVQAVKYCKGRSFLSTGAGDVLQFPDFNLRIKTDFSETGPVEGKPALLPAAMMGDRAFLVFSDPAEISRYIENTCAIKN